MANYKHSFLGAMTVLAMLYSCRNDGAIETTNLSIPFNEENTILLESIFESVDYMVPDTIGGVIFGDPGVIRQFKDDIYISDYRSIYRYDTYGKCLNVFSHQGRGPREYTSITDFVIMDNRVIILNARVKKLLIYTLDDQYVDEMHIDEIVSSIGVLNDSTIICNASYQNEGSKFYVYNINTKNREGAWGHITLAQCNYMHFIGQNQFSYHDGQLLFNEAMNNSICIIRQDTIIEKYHFDLFGKNPPADFYNASYADVMDYMDKFKAAGYLSGTPHFAEGEHSLLFTMAGTPPRMCSYNKTDKSALQFYYVKIDETANPINVMDLNYTPQHDGRIIFSIPISALFNDDGKLVTTKFGIRKQNDNTIICIAKLK